MHDKTPALNYPLAEKEHHHLRMPSGIPFDDIALESVLDRRVQMDDLRVTAETLEMQAKIADACGRPQLAENFRRAAELVAVPQSKILEIYNALRPARAARGKLMKLAEQLETGWHATRCAKFIRDAADVCAQGNPDREAQATGSSELA